MLSLVRISQLVGWEGWVFCTSQEVSWEDRLWNDSVVEHNLLRVGQTYMNYGVVFTCCMSVCACDYVGDGEIYDDTIHVTSMSDICRCLSHVQELLNILQNNLTTIIAQEFIAEETENDKFTKVSVLFCCKK